MSADIRVIQCNLAAATKSASKGAVAFVLLFTGGAEGRLPLLIRSRGGRWIEKWESITRIDNFRSVTIPEQHPLRTKLLEGGAELASLKRIQALKSHA